MSDVFQNEINRLMVLTDGEIIKEYANQLMNVSTISTIQVQAMAHVIEEKGLEPTDLCFTLGYKDASGIEKSVEFMTL